MHIIKTIVSVIRLFLMPYKWPTKMGSDLIYRKEQIMINDQALNAK